MNMGLKMKWFYALFFAPFAAQALYNGNPSFPGMPEEGIFISKESYAAIKVGYLGNLVFDRRLKMIEVPHGEDKRIDRFSFLTGSGILTLNFNDRVELFGELGEIAVDFSHRPLPTVRIEYHSSGRGIWGGGARAVAAKWGNAELGMEGRFAQTLPQIRWFSVNGMAEHGEHPRLSYLEWQIGLSFSHKGELLIPYMGIKYSAVLARLSGVKAVEPLFTEGKFSMRSRAKVGLFLGCGMTPAKTIDLNFEVRLSDEEAIALSGDIRF